ncbi:MAG TPA: hypothetical protein PLW50_00690 [Smithellaceae bacterium]|nr:hypothetical protein [Smithellaceae bacterium]
MSNRTRKISMRHVRMTVDFLVPSISSRDAMEGAVDALVDMIEDEEKELEDIFKLEVLNNKFHVLEVLSEDGEDEEDDEEDDED